MKILNYSNWRWSRYSCIWSCHWCCYLYKTLEEKELSTIERKTKIREIYCQA